MISAVIAALRRAARRARAAAPSGLLPPAEVARVLATERARADRTGECLSVVVFTPRVDEAPAATWDILGRIVRTRLRVTDAAGWLDRNRVCAILPFTPAPGA